MSGLALQDMIGFLVNRRFPVKPIGALGGKILTDKGLVPAAEHLANANRFRQELEKLPTEELQSRYADALEQDRQKALAAEAALPFNQSYAMADFDYWAKHTY